MSGALVRTAAPLPPVEELMVDVLGKPWTKPGTKQRNGGARFADGLEPHLIDPNSSGEAAALVSYATDRRVTKGRPATLTPAVEAIVRQTFEDDEAVAAIAERFKGNAQRGAQVEEETRLRRRGSEAGLGAASVWDTAKPRRWSQLTKAREQGASNASWRVFAKVLGSKWGAEIRFWSDAGLAPRLNVRPL